MPGKFWLKTVCRKGCACPWYGSYLDASSPRDKGDWNVSPRITGMSKIIMIGRMTIAINWMAPSMNGFSSACFWVVLHSDDHSEIWHTPISYWLLPISSPSIPVIGMLPCDLHIKNLDNHFCGQFLDEFSFGNSLYWFNLVHNHSDQNDIHQ